MEQAKPIRPFTGKHMLALVLAFFGVVIGVNALMATLAVRSWTGLVVKSTYVASLEFNDKLAASQAQADLNWKVGLTYQEGILQFDLTDDQNQPVNVQSVNIEVSRPIGIAEDRTLDLERIGEGFGIATDIPSGVWNVVIRAEVADYPQFLYRARLFVDVPITPLS